jgi:acetyl-CoA carboxylase biotin carboxyl carrier protein
VTLDFNEIRQLLVTIAQTDIAEVTLKNNEFELTVRKAVSFSNNAQGTVSAVGSASVTQLLSTALPSSMSEGGVIIKLLIIYIIRLLAQILILIQDLLQNLLRIYKKV